MAAVEPERCERRGPPRARRERVGDHLGDDHPEHRAAGEAEPKRYQTVEEGDEEEGGDATSG